MFEEMNKILLSGKEYPIKCDLLVLEKAQEAYGSINAFEEGLITWEAERDKEGKEIYEKGKLKVHGKFPDARTVNDALFWMICEGEAIAAEEEGRPTEKMERAAIIRKADLTLTDLANKIHGEFYRCFNSKNGKTT